MGVKPRRLFRWTSAPSDKTSRFYAQSYLYFLGRARPRKIYLRPRKGRWFKITDCIIKRRMLSTFTGPPPPPFFILPQFYRSPYVSCINWSMVIYKHGRIITIERSRHGILSQRSFKGSIYRLSPLKNLCWDDFSGKQELILQRPITSRFNS